MVSIGVGMSGQVLRATWASRKSLCDENQSTLMSGETPQGEGHMERSSWRLEASHQPPLYTEGWVGVVRGDASSMH